jgi:hypothetical protein
MPTKNPETGRLNRESLGQDNVRKMSGGRFIA